MKVKHYTGAPLILTDLLAEPRPLPQLTDEEILAMQPASTQTLMKMKDDEPFIIRENFQAERDPHKLRPDMIDEEGKYTQKALDLLEERKSRVHDSYYHADRTALIHKDNKDGKLELGTHPEWEKHLIIDKLKHNTEIKALKIHPKIKEEKWIKMTTWEALKHWLKGGKVKQEVDLD